MLRPDTFSLTAMLALLTAVGPLSVDMYLPSLPDIGRELAAPPAQVQLTISFYLVGFALGQILYGPLSDCHGRKPILLAALALFGTASLACAFAWSIEMLIARFFQAFGGAGAVVLARAIVRDLYSEARAGREFSLMGAVMAVAPTGGLALAAGGLAMVVAVALGLTSAASLVLPAAFYLTGLGLAMPQGFAGAMSPFPGRAGAASSLVGFVQQTSAAALGAVVGHMLSQTAWPLVVAIASMGCLTLVIWMFSREIRAPRKGVEIWEEQIGFHHLRNDGSDSHTMWLQK
jgi:DHA1 family bicyclomycin/chloramphenicol resistance-like MFS transporter